MLLPILEDWNGCSLTRSTIKKVSHKLNQNIIDTFQKYVAYVTAITYVVTVTNFANDVSVAAFAAVDTFAASTAIDTVADFSTDGAVDNLSAVVSVSGYTDIASVASFASLVFDDAFTAVSAVYVTSFINNFTESNAFVAASDSTAIYVVDD